MLQCTIYQSMDVAASPTEYDMSKRLTTSAIIATLLLAATSFYSAEHSQQETTSRTVLMGG